MRTGVSLCRGAWLDAGHTPADLQHLLLHLLLLQGGCEDPHYRMVGAAADLFHTMHGEDT